MGISIDDSRWPIVEMRIVGEMSAADIDKHFRVTTPALCGRGKFASIIDARAADLPRFDAAVRHKLSVGLRETRIILTRQLICESYVIDSAVARGIITAVWWVVPPAWPASVLGTLSEAVNWTHQHVRQTDLSLRDE
jgi:hypothetical protein